MRGVRLWLAGRHRWVVFANHDDYFDGSMRIPAEWHGALRRLFVNALCWLTVNVGSLLLVIVIHLGFLFPAGWLHHINTKTGPEVSLRKTF